MCCIHQLISEGQKSVSFRTRNLFDAEKINRNTFQGQRFPMANALGFVNNYPYHPFYTAPTDEQRCCNL